MNIKKIKIFKKDERGTIYECGKARYIIRKKGTVSADHTHKVSEVLFLLEGKVKLTIDNKTKIVKAPAKIEIPSNIYHKLLALSDIRILYYR